MKEDLSTMPTLCLVGPPTDRKLPPAATGGHALHLARNARMVAGALGCAVDRAGDLFSFTS
jgi:hypothetical protein